jgi:hypothetical protein
MNIGVSADKYSNKISRFKCGSSVSVGCSVSPVVADPQIYIPVSISLLCTGQPACITAESSGAE